MPLQAMAEITARGKIPLLVGGTMLYYKALVDGLADMPAGRSRASVRRSKKTLHALAGKPCTISWRSSTRNRRRVFIRTIRSG